MNNFSFRNPTKLIFGKGQLETLNQELPNHCQKILLVYGGGSIKKNGLYDEVKEKLDQKGVTVFELAGVEPNPRLSTVHKGVEICKREEIDFILAVGGGSVIDCVKAISVGAEYDGDVWEIITRKASPSKAVPFGTVLTLAATGSEMNPSSVVTNWETKEKIGWSSPITYPQFSILDPTYTFSVPKDQTIYGIVDIMSHILEQYFHHIPNTPINDGMCESLLRTVIETAPKLIDDLENYEYRETILLSGTMALIGVLSMGSRGDWATHNIEHAVSAVTDIPHGGGLAIIFPEWMKLVVDEKVERFKQLAERVWDVETAGKSDREIALEGIEKLQQFWISLGAPSKLADYKIDQSKIEEMTEKAMTRGEFGHFKRLNKEDVTAILTNSL
ncbi:iron-containing alcohol dehydrogenase [Anaerobacillus sp. MEB173]|uniref:iron-containing alcohol dehydrogenase n=1 Tax=Anaerobacillus sp. MEB173 TaxID=3383345 RepID=UPI003F918287